MTVIAKLSTLNEAYAGIAALKTRAILAGLARLGEEYLIGVDKTHQNAALNALEREARFAGKIVRDNVDHDYLWIDFEGENN